MGSERIETLIIGGGQEGLAAAYHLKQRGRGSLIVDANPRTGDAWRNRWDSLRLFTPARFDGLPGMPFPASGWYFPTKDEMADLLQRYADTFELPRRLGTRVDRLAKEDGRFVVTAGDQRFEADNVVVATGGFGPPKVPPFASELDTSIVQFHSSAYRNPSQLREGRVLIVGAGNSGAEIAFELAATHETMISGTPAGQLPLRHDSKPARVFFRIFRFMMHRVIRTDTPIGRKAIPKMALKADPLIRRRRKDLDAVGVKWAARVAGVKDGLPVLEDGTVVETENVIWCTGYGHDYPWIDLPAFDAAGKIDHVRGVVQKVPGLYFTGLHFQYSASSGVLPAQFRDAKYVVDQIVASGKSASTANGLTSVVAG